MKLFNPVVNLGITLVPWKFNISYIILKMLKISKIVFSKSQNIMKEYSICWMEIQN